MTSTRLRETSWAALAGGVQSVGPFGSFLILARLAPADELGRYSIAVAITVPLFLVARMQLRQAAVADPHGGHAFGNYRILRLMAATSMLVLAWCLSGAVDRELAAVLGACAFVRWAEDIGDIHYAPLQRAALWPRIVASQLIRVGGGLGVLLIAWDRLGLPMALVCVGLWHCVITLLVDLRLAQSLESTVVDWSVIGRLVLLNWPLGGAAAVISLLSYTPRYALAWAHGEALVGDYAALCQIALMGNLIVQGAGQASLSRLGVSFIRDRVQFALIVRELLALACAVAMCGLVGAVLWGDVLLAAVFQPRFADLSAALVGMMVESLFVYATSVYGYALTAAGVKKQQLAIFCVALVVGAGTAFPLSAAYGIGGAVVSSVVCWATAALLSGALLRRACLAVTGDELEGVGTLKHRVGHGGAV